MSLKLAARVLLSLVMIAAGAMHFLKPGFYVRIVPPFLPNPALLVAISGVFEILGGIGLFIPQTRAFAAWGLIALFVAVFPANLYVAFSGMSYVEGQSALAPWIRLPFQAVFIIWAWWFTRR